MLKNDKHDVVPNGEQSLNTSSVSKICYVICRWDEFNKNNCLLRKYIWLQFFWNIFYFLILDEGMWETVIRIEMITYWEQKSWNS